MSAHFIFAFNPSPITTLAIHKSQEITYSIQAPTALSLPCLSTHMFRKVSQTVPTFCFYRTENIPLVPSMFYLCLASRSFPTSQHLLSARLTVQLSAFCLFTIVLLLSLHLLQPYYSPFVYIVYSVVLAPSLALYKKYKGIVRKNNKICSPSICKLRI